ncbi:hypothetical protein Salat_1430100 [Sesamum alatum]|uniref:Uncharacterized protein n=1 Tax=Sesamum alatum TaxID=300844 RepID=A0AAE1YAT0_9LAMI|nr:hypothetical protein Salat_1430100 [Sesamum alatum]
MVRPAKTRFATVFLTLKRFHVEKSNLKKMFTSKMWTKSKHAKDAQRKLVASIILMPSFWNHVAYALKVAGPLVKVLRTVNAPYQKNRLEQQRLNDLVFIKYNKAYTIDLIALDERDEFNEWMLGRLNTNSDDDIEENARVFEDDDLTWAYVARAAGVDEDAYAFRPRSSKNITSKA